jgi:hypothetical protein
VKFRRPTHPGFAVVRRRLERLAPQDGGDHHVASITTTGGLTPRAVRARAMPRMLVTPLPCIASASAISLQALMEARRAAASRGPLVRYVEPIQGNHQVEKLTHCSACFENDWRFCGSAFCTPTSSPQVRRHVAGKRVHPHRSAEAPATDAYEGLS